MPPPQRKTTADRVIVTKIFGDSKTCYCAFTSSALPIREQIWSRRRLKQTSVSPWRFRASASSNRSLSKLSYMNEAQLPQQPRHLCSPQPSTTALSHKTEYSSELHKGQYDDDHRSLKVLEANWAQLLTKLKLLVVHEADRCRSTPLF